MLSELNLTKNLSNVLYGEVDDKLSKKSIYIEGLIRFLELYATNEIGEVEADIQKVSLWVNSPKFENIDIRKITDITSVYKMLEEDIINNIPIHRFLKLSSYQSKILEREHYDTLLNEYNKDCEEYPCLKCIWYDNGATSLGSFSKCTIHDIRELVINHSFMSPRQSYLDIEKYKNCKCCTTLTNVPDILLEHISDGHRFNKIKSSEIEMARNRLSNKIKNLDNSYIPITVDEEDIIDLSEKDDSISDLCRVFGNKQAKSEMRNNLRNAMMLEAMIKFFDVYAQTEVGTDYQANISNINNWIYNQKFTFTNVSECYNIIENDIIMDNKYSVNIEDFVCRVKV